MKFEVTRTSRRADTDPLCPGAQQEQVGQRRPWTIELNSLAELANFIHEHGPCVLAIYGPFPELEIYDTWRE